MSTLEMVLWASLGLMVGLLIIWCCCLAVPEPRLPESDDLIEEADFAQNAAEASRG